MNTKVFSIILAVIVVAGVGIWLTRGPADYASITNYEECAAAGYPIMESYPERCATPDGRTFTRVIVDDVSDLIQVNAPTVNAIVSSPMTISGRARGNWYFEASFPVQLLDANGLVLYEGPIQADGEWMTTEFVPFNQTITFTPATTETGTLVLKKDNPSGLPENDKEVRVPVRFKEVSSRNAEFNSEVSLSVGDRIIFSDSLVISLQEINDSRCQPNVQCIWAGELAPLLIVGKAKSEVRLGTVNNQSVTFGNYTFVLIKATEKIATIKVNKIAGAKTGEVQGYVHVGPTCPVERVPADPECADKPYSVSIEIHYPDERLHSIIKSGADGRFLVTLPTGQYLLRPQMANVMPSCAEVSVAVTANAIINTDISCDSGIR